MNITQNQTVEDGVDARTKDPFVPPAGNVCFVKKLPNELLLRIFELNVTNRHIGCHCHRNNDGDSDADDSSSEDSELDEGHEDEDEDKDDGEENKDEEDPDEEFVEEELGPQEDEEDEDTDSEYEADCPSAVTFSHVCRHWRNVALSSPSLWRTIDVYATEGQSHRLESLMLERSKTLPIDICVVSRPSGTTGSSLPDLFPMLIPHVHRWRSVEILVYEYHNVRTFLTAFSDPSLPKASQLKKLSLHFETRNDDDDDATPSELERFTLFAGSTPSLTVLHLSGVYVDWDAPWITSAPNLRCLYLAYVEETRLSLARIFTILRGAPSLEHLFLGWVLSAIETVCADLSTPVQLARLTKLHVRGFSQREIVTLLRCISIPAIETLGIGLHPCHGHRDYTQFVHELVRPAMTLHAQGRSSSLASRLAHLNIVDFPCEDSCITTLYGELQNLRSLRLFLEKDVPCWSLDILCTACTLPGRGDVWLPRLEALHVCKADWRTLREIVERRRDSGVPLSAMSVGEHVETKNLKWLKRNVKEVKIWYRFGRCSNA